MVQLRVWHRRLPEVSLDPAALGREGALRLRVVQHAAHAELASLDEPEAIAARGHHAHDVQRRRVRRRAPRMDFEKRPHAGGYAVLNVEPVGVRVGVRPERADDKGQLHVAAVLAVHKPSARNDAGVACKHHHNDRCGDSGCMQPQSPKRPWHSLVAAHVAPPNCLTLSLSKVPEGPSEATRRKLTANSPPSHFTRPNARRYAYTGQVRRWHSASPFHVSFPLRHRAVPYRTMEKPHNLLSFTPKFKAQARVRHAGAPS